MIIPFTKYRKIYFIFSGLVVLASIIVLFVFGLKPGIDFTGGSILEVQYIGERPNNDQIREQLSEFDLGNIYVQPTGDNGVILRMKDIDEEMHQGVLAKLGEIELEQGKFESIGPVIGRELKQKTRIVVLLVLLSIVIYIAFAFRRIKMPLRSWQYGVTSVLALFHDILIPFAVFSVLGHLYGVEITIPVITAMLAVLGYSINNTVVVFDRIREGLLKRGGYFEDVVDSSLSQTLARQINTSITTLFVVLAIFFFGGATLKFFALALIVGIIAGTYSSIFLAGSILVSWFKWKNRHFSE